MPSMPIDDHYCDDTCSECMDCYLAGHHRCDRDCPHTERITPATATAIGTMAALTAINAILDKGGN